MTLQTSGAISLNDIHVEAGGTSGTSATINDADIRGLIGKAASTTMSFNEWYGASAVNVTVPHTASFDSTTTAGTYARFVPFDLEVDDLLVVMHGIYGTNITTTRAGGTTLPLVTSIGSNSALSIGYLRMTSAYTADTLQIYGDSTTSRYHTLHMICVRGLPSFSLIDSATAVTTTNLTVNTGSANVLVVGAGTYSSATAITGTVDGLIQSSNPFRHYTTSYAITTAANSTETINVSSSNPSAALSYG